MERAEKLVQRKERGAVVAIEVTMMELVIKAPQSDHAFTLDQQITVAAVGGDGVQRRVIHVEQHMNRMRGHDQVDQN